MFPVPKLHVSSLFLERKEDRRLSYFWVVKWTLHFLTSWKKLAQWTAGGYGQCGQGY